MSIHINKVSDEFVCPYCLHTSKLSKIQFRSKNKYLERYADSKNEHFWKQTGYQGPAVTAPMAVSPRAKKRGLKTTANSALAKVPIGYFDEGRQFTDDRVCPMCHNSLPRNIGFVPTANIIVLGMNRDDCFNYFIRLFRSMKENCIIDNVQFFLPQPAVNQIVAGNTGNTDDISFLIGKMVMFKKDKVLCDISVSFIHMGIKRLRKMDEQFVFDRISNANGVIFVDNGEYLDNENMEAMERYLLDLSNHYRQIGLAVDAAPVALVLTGKDCVAVDYEAETQQKSTEQKIAYDCSEFYVQFKSIFSNCAFFTAGEDHFGKKESYQFPLKWITDTLNIYKQKDTKEEM